MMRRASGGPETPQRNRKKIKTNQIDGNAQSRMGAAPLMTALQISQLTLSNSTCHSSRPQSDLTVPKFI